MNIQLASIQMICCPGDIAGNCQKAEKLIAEAAAAGANIILLPEFWNTGYDPKLFRAFGAYAEDQHGPSVAMMKEAAQRHHVYLVGGTIAEKRSDGVYNTSMLLDPNGHLLNKYRKVHLFRAEQEFFKPGDEWTLEDLKLEETDIRLGMCACYDLRFPEFFRNIALRGAKLFSLPVAWPEARIREYRIFCQARAAENRCYLIAANHTGAPGSVYSGNSMIVDPLGRILAEAGSEEGFILGEMDTEIFQRSEVFSAMEERKHFLDEIDDSLL